MAPDLADLVASECAAFLAGTYRLHLVALERPVPAWAYINEVAHGERAAIEALATTFPRPVGPRALVCDIAARLIFVLEHRQTPLCLLQTMRLLPLEARLAGSAAPPPETAADLAEAIASVLREGSRSWLPPSG